MKIDYVSRGAFLPAMSLVAKERGEADPLDALTLILPIFEFMAENVFRPWCTFEPDDPKHFEQVMNPFTRVELDLLDGRDRACAAPFITLMDAWMERFSFRDEWIFDAATATFTGAIIDGINDPAGKRVMKWRRSFDPKCGRLPPVQDDDPDWAYWRTESAAAFGRNHQRWYNQFLKESKAEIQFRQGERFNYEQASILAAQRFAGATWTDLAGGPARGRGVFRQAMLSPVTPDTIRKAVAAYCDRTGLSMPGEPHRGISIN